MRWDREHGLVFSQRDLDVAFKLRLWVALGLAAIAGFCLGAALI